MIGALGYWFPMKQNSYGIRTSYRPTRSQPLFAHYISSELSSALCFIAIEGHHRITPPSLNRLSPPNASATTNERFTTATRDTELGKGQ